MEIKLYTFQMGDLIQCGSIIGIVVRHYFGCSSLMPIEFRNIVNGAKCTSFPDNLQKLG
jgi:hypothetical protein